MSSVTSVKLFGNFTCFKTTDYFLCTCWGNSISPLEVITYLFNKIKNAFLLFITLDLSPDVETKMTSVISL